MAVKKKKTEIVRAALYIGAQVEAIKEVRATIMNILTCKDADGPTKIAAFDALTKICSVNNCTVSNCTFNGNE